MATLADATLDLDLGAATTSAREARARCQKLARELSRHLGPSEYREFREAARAFQRCETTAEAFATTLIQALGCSGVGGALAREAVRTTPASFQRAALRAALGAALDDGRAGGDIGRNESGLDDHQQLLVRRQDEDLDDISVSISRIGQVGLTIGDELASQSKMLEDLEEDVDGVNARLAAAERKMREVLKKVGLRGQICVIIFLTIILFILFAIAFQ